MNSVFKIGLSLILLLTVHTTATAQADFCGIKNNSFKEGEKLTFTVFYNMGFIWINAGEANFTTEAETINGKKVFHITGDGKTNKSHEWIFKVRDKYETYIEADNMLPVKFIRDVHEGNISIYNHVTFDQNAGKAYSTKGSYNVPHCVQDVLSTIYYARNINYNQYKPGDRIPFTMFLDDQVYSLYIRYLGKEQVTTKYGTFNAIKIAPLLIKGTIFKGGEKMEVWVSDDENHLPLRVNSPILVGSIKVDLTACDNLRHPFNSMISSEE